MKEHKLRARKWPNDLGNTIPVETKDNKQYIFVAINHKLLDDQFEAFDTIVHESVHVWQFAREWAGDSMSEGSPPKPMTEVEAYSIAHIAKTLFKEYSCRG